MTLNFCLFSFLIHIFYSFVRNMIAKYVNDRNLTTIVMPYSKLLPELLSYSKLIPSRIIFVILAIKIPKASIIK